MRIAIIVSTYPPYAGGIGNAAEHEAIELARLGHEITVFTPRYTRDKGKDDKRGVKPRGGHAAIRGVKIIRLRPLFKFGNAACLPQLLWRPRNFDVVYLHYPFFGGAEFAALAFWLSDISRLSQMLFIRYHMDTVGRGMLGRFFKWHTKYIMPKILRKADKILVSSFDYARMAAIARLLEKSPDKFVEIPFGVDSEKFRPEPKEQKLLEQYKISKDDKIVLFVGGLDRAHYFKGIEVLFGAHKLLITNYKLLKIKLIIVGDGDLRPQYEKIAGELGIFSHTLFVGKVPAQELPEYYNLADVLVLPSLDRSEAFGIVLLEAAACEKPLIASNLPGVQMVCQNNINGFLVEPKNPDDLAEKIFLILTHPELAKVMGERGRKMILEKYNWKKIREILYRPFAK